jgi:uncharacterized protein (TIGR03435 family)
MPVDLESSKYVSGLHEISGNIWPMAMHSACVSRPAIFLRAFAIACSLLFPFARHAHSQNQRAPSFEVVSIRPVTGGESGDEGSSRSQIESGDGSLTMRNIDLSEMIQWAYRLDHYQLTGPNMLEGQRFDVRAKAGDRVTDSTLRLMLQDLLATRFKLQLRREQKKTSVYELVVAKDGPRLPKDKSDTLPAAYQKESFPRVVDGSFVFRNVSLGEFSQQLTELRGIEFPVIDRTGIPGVYDITLKSAASALLDPGGPSLLTLIQEQLGLKLVPAKDPIEVVVVDHAEPPSAN